MSKKKEQNPQEQPEELTALEQLKQLNSRSAVTAGLLLEVLTELNLIEDDER